MDVRSRDPAAQAGGHTGREFARVAKNASVVAAALGGIIGSVSATLGLLFLIRPNLAPSTGNRAEITQIALEPRVTLHDYLLHFSVAKTWPRVQRALPKDHAQVWVENVARRSNTLGTVIHFGLQVDGLHGIHIGQRWSLFDGDTGIRLGESEALDPLPLDFSPEKNGADTGSWEVWVDTSQFAARNFFVRLELYEEGDDTRITFKDTPSFTRPSG